MLSNGYTYLNRGQSNTSYNICWLLDLLDFTKKKKKKLSYSRSWAEKIYEVIK